MTIMGRFDEESLVRPGSIEYSDPLPKNYLVWLSAPAADDDNELCFKICAAYYIILKSFLYVCKSELLINFKEKKKKFFDLELEVRRIPAKGPHHL